jgi:hypothetical protein
MTPRNWVSNSQNFWDVKRTVCGRFSGNPTPKLEVIPPKTSKGLGVNPLIEKIN